MIIIHEPVVIRKITSSNEIESTSISWIGISWAISFDDGIISSLSYLSTYELRHANDRKANE